MTLEDQKEHFSYAYIRAIASAAAVSVSTPEVDDDSIDLILLKKNVGPVFRSPRLEVQVKCSDESNVSRTPTDLRFPLKLKNYDELRAADVLVPRILIVVLVPSATHDWTNWTPTELAVRRSGYWTSLRGLPQTNNSTTVTVSVPLSNEFSVTQLDAIINRIGNGALP